MNQQSKLMTAVLVLLCFWLGSCSKERSEQKANENVTTSTQNKQPSEAGFADNDMVMYWNEKAAIILNEHTNPGADARAFAMIQIAVHDALNSIKPKYHTYALLKLLNKEDQNNN